MGWDSGDKMQVMGMERAGMMIEGWGQGVAGVPMVDWNGTGRMGGTVGTRWWPWELEGDSEDRMGSAG